MDEGESDNSRIVDEDYQVPAGLNGSNNSNENDRVTRRRGGECEVSHEVEVLFTFSF